MTEPKIGIIIGSQSDWPIVEKALQNYKDLDLPCIVKLASAHRAPEVVDRWVKDAENAGVEVIIAVAGMAAALPGVVASRTLLPVIGVPVDTGPLRGEDALYSIVQMPTGVPVATVGINNVKNALILSLHILALKYPDFKKRLVTFRKSEAAKLEAAHQDIIQSHPQFALSPRPVKVEIAEMKIPPQTEEKKSKDPFVSPGDIENARASVAIKVPPAPQISRSKLICTLDPDNPRYEDIEKAADMILDGKIIAIPTDTVYGLACDSTNAKAVKKLFELKGREKNKPIPVLIDAMRILSRLVRHIPPDVQLMLEELWPGPLTVVFPKPETMLSAIAPGQSIGIRMPDATIALSVISMVARPLGVTSANPSGQAPARTALEVEEYFGGRIDLILDGGELTRGDVSTVLSVVEEPYILLRPGAVAFDTLKKFLTNLVEEK